MFVGEDVIISKNVEIKRPDTTYIGNHVAIDSGFYCTVSLVIRNYVHISPYVTVIGGREGSLYVGSFCTISAGARIICRGDSFSGNGLVGPLIPDEYKNTVIGATIFMDDFSALGTNAILMPNVNLARGVVVGANSLVLNSIDEPWTVWAGSPARKIKDRRKEKMLEYARRMGYE